MCTMETVKCPHCGKPRLIQPARNDTPELIGREPCSECFRIYLEEIADTLFAILTTRLEAGGRPRCCLSEQAQKDLPSGPMFRRILRVESLDHRKVRVGEAAFVFGSA